MRPIHVLALLLAVSGLPALAQPSPTPSPAAAPLGSKNGFDEAATPTPSPSGVQTLIILPGGTTVAISLVEPLTSSKAEVDETVPIVVDRDVDANGYVLIPKGANGQMTITSVDRAGGNGHGGKLGFQVDWVYSADHGRIQLSDVNHATSEETDKKGAASTASILSYVFLGPVGLFFHNFVRGRDAQIDTKQVFTVFVDHDVHVLAVQPMVAAPGFDH